VKLKDKLGWFGPRLQNLENQIGYLEKLKAEFKGDLNSLLREYAGLQKQDLPYVFTFSETYNLNYNIPYYKSGDYFARPNNRLGDIINVLNAMRVADSIFATSSRIEILNSLAEIDLSTVPDNDIRFGKVYKPLLRLLRRAGMSSEDLTLAAKPSVNIYYDGEVSNQEALITEILRRLGLSEAEFYLGTTYDHIYSGVPRLMEENVVGFGPSYVFNARELKSKLQALSKE
jgi:hypothetical protein